MKQSLTRQGPWLALFGGLAVSAQTNAAGTIQIDGTRSVSIGAGLRTQYETVEDSAPNGTDDSSDFVLQSTRLYISGQASEKVKFTFNTDNAAGIDVLDAIAQFELSPEFNIWIGRMLTPADRIEMNGPYYGLTWNQFTVPLFPSDNFADARAGIFGRDEGVTIWGATGKFQYAFGLFDGVQGEPNMDDNLLFATRLAYNFLDMEMNPGYYTSSTYFGGGGDIFTIGFSYQTQDDAYGDPLAPSGFSGWAVDVLFEKPLAGGAALTIEGEIKDFDVDDCFTCEIFQGDSMFVSFAYLLPGAADAIKWQPYVRYVENDPDGGFLATDSDLVEVGLNMIIKGHNARLNLNWSSGDANLTGLPGPDVDKLSFGVQVQI